MWARLWRLRGETATTTTTVQLAVLMRRLRCLC
jgi:hypothetical protein